MRHLINVRIVESSNSGCPASTDKVRPLLVFSNRHEVRGVELPSLSSRALVASLKNTIALDWRTDPATNDTHLYWTDVVDDNIYRGTLAGTGALPFRYSFSTCVSTSLTLM